MSDPSAPPDSPPPPRKRFQFTLKTMLGITALFAFLCGMFAGMHNAHIGIGSLPRGTFVLLAIAAPMIVMMGVSVYYALRGPRRRR